MELMEFNGTALFVKLLCQSVVKGTGYSQEAIKWLVCEDHW